MYIPPGEPPPPYEASLPTAIPSYNSLPQAHVMSDCNLQVELPRYSSSLLQTNNQNCFQLNEPVGNEISVASDVVPQCVVNATDVLRSDAQYDDRHGLNTPQPTQQSGGQSDVGAVEDSSSNNRSNLGLQLVNSESLNWGNCPTDTSSSSPSPTCNRTISPTSSECSSILEFTLPNSSRKSDSTLPKRPNTSSKYFHHPYWNNRTSRVSSSLDKKLCQFRRFSLMRMKQKSKREDAGQQPSDNVNVNIMTESQCSTVSNPETSSWILTNPDLTAEESDRTPEICSQDNLHQGTFRPRSLNLPSYDYTVNPCNSATRKSDVQPNDIENLRRIFIPSNANCSFRDSSRSGSICSETGERRYRRNAMKTQKHAINVGCDPSSAARDGDPSVKAKMSSISARGAVPFKLDDVKASQRSHLSKDANNDCLEYQQTRSNVSRETLNRRKSLDDVLVRRSVSLLQGEDVSNRKSGHHKSNDDQQKSVWVPISRQAEADARAHSNRPSFTLLPWKDSHESRM